MSDEDYKVGYRKPPKRTQFKKGQSGAPDGGWPQRLANKAAAAKAAEEKAQLELAKKKKDELSIAQKLINIARTKRPARINGAMVEIEGIEAVFLSLQEDAIAKDPLARQRYLHVIDKLGELDPPAPAAAPQGTLVLYEPARTDEEWEERVAKMPQLPLDPIEGLPGITRDMIKGPFRKRPPEDDQG